MEVIDVDDSSYTRWANQDPPGLSLADLSYVRIVKPWPFLGYVELVAERSYHRLGISQQHVCIAVRMGRWRIGVWKG